MVCGNYLCIYFSKGSCLRDDITLDNDGRCLQCIYINMDDEKLEEIRAKMRENRKISDMYSLDIF